MIKVLFALDIVDGWPPVATEGVWCEKKGDKYRLLNAPFFIKGLAPGDEFLADHDTVNNHVFDFKVCTESGHSVIWFLNTDSVDIQGSITSIESIGCKAEIFGEYNLHSIDVPADINVTKLNEVIQELERRGVAVAYPIWRHD